MQAKSKPAAKAPTLMDILGRCVAERNAARAALARLEEKRAEAEAVIASADGALSELRAARRKIVGAAFVNGCEPDTAQIDARIAEAEAFSAKASRGAAAARHALPIIAEQTAAAQVAEAAAAQAVALAKADVLAERFDVAFDAVQAAICELGAPVNAMLACRAAMAAVDRDIVAAVGTFFEQHSGFSRRDSVCRRQMESLSERGVYFHDGERLTKPDWLRAYLGGNPWTDREKTAFGAEADRLLRELDVDATGDL